MSHESIRDLAALASVVSATVESYQPQEVMRIALERLVEVLPVDGAVIHLLEGQDLVLTARLNMLNDPNGEFERFPLDDKRISGLCVTRNAPILLDERFPESCSSFERQGMKSGAAIPIPGPMGPVGTLVVGSAQPVSLTDDHFVLLLAVTNQIGVALEHARLVDRLERQVEQVQEQLMKRERLATLGQLAGSLGHELRGPLVNLQMALNLLEGADEAMKAELITRMGRELTRCNSVINDLLDYTRSREPTRTSTSLAAIVHQAVRSLQGEPGLQVEVRADDVERVSVDPDQVLRLLENVLTNANQAVGGRGRVLVALRQDDEAVELRVEDSGPGVPEDQRERIFEPLVTTRRSGTGLGLAVCRRTMDAHGGRIQVVPSAELGGAAFVIRFPRHA